MRVQQKKEIIAILDEYNLVFDEIKKAFIAREIGTIQNTLADLQEYTSEIMEVIRKDECGQESVEKLETLYVQLYNLHEKVGRQEKIEDLLDSLITLVREVLDLVKMLPVKIEMLFLPYKASMWDSMESVWEAASLDSECDCYVVPVPFYERIGTNLVPRYEGECFPKYVTITPCQNYDIPARQPDIIIIHNPFDDYNRVTQLDERYFSRELKKHTRMLVYIPYFLIGKGPMPESHLSLPAYDHADIIVVQDEEKLHSLLDTVEEEKLLAVGSPKVDRILREQRRRKKIINTEIPDNWRKAIQGKKVIFFNISINGILQESKYALKKIRYVISKFESRDDAVLIWRPHPLLEATLKSMRPDIYAEYLQIKNEYVLKNIGIIDENPDNMMAVALADAYIGENTSSMIYYFGVLGKPIYCIGWSILSEKSSKERSAIPFSCVEAEKEGFYISPIDFGEGPVLGKVDYTVGKYNSVLKMPGVDISEQAYYDIRQIGNCIVMAPYKAKDIYIYNIERGQAVKLPVRMKSEGPFFIGVVPYEGKVYFVPARYQAVVSVDLKTLEYEENLVCLKNFLPKVGQDNLFCWRSWVVKDHFMYLFSAVWDKVLIYDLDEGCGEGIELSGCKKGYLYAEAEGSNVWMIGRDQDLYLWNMENRNIKRYHLPWTMDEKVGYCSIAVCDNQVYVFNTCAERVFLIKNKCETPIIVIPNITFKRSLMVLAMNDKGTLYLLNMDKGILVENDLLSGEWKETECCFNKTQVLKKTVEEINLLYANEAYPYIISEKNIGISAFVDYIVAEGYKERSGRPEMIALNSDCESYGNRIYRKLKEKLWET